MWIVTMLLLLGLTSASASPVITVGAKHFNEGYILGEMLAQTLEDAGFTVSRKFSLGGTLVCFEALRNGAIDCYPEYTGTLGEEILRAPHGAGIDMLRDILEAQNDLALSDPYGFNNTYALAIRREVAQKLHIGRMSDLAAHPELNVSVSYEFLKRRDGWHTIADLYHLKNKVAGIEHGLAYEAINSGKIDVTDVYSTDGEIPKYNLTLLRDDRHVFPSYLAVTLFRKTLPPGAAAAIAKLAGRISDSAMQAMNASVVFDGLSAADVARSFLRTQNIIGNNGPDLARETVLQEIFDKTLTHLKLTGIALMIAILVAVPMGVVIYRWQLISKPVMYFAGLLQTIPSIALLALMIPIFGIGMVPAVIALCLYGLLPILRNTTSALQGVDPLLKSVGTAIGLTRWQRLRYVELPLSIPTIFAGVRTAAVINVGTATLAAFIGAGGLGEFIVTGLALNSTEIILKGAIPAAVLAIVVEYMFELMERALTPAHLRKREKG